LQTLPPRSSLERITHCYLVSNTRIIKESLQMADESPA
jgi:hypothetical protein